MVFDTETTSLEKPFCYDVGYTIIDTERWESIVKRSFVVEQVWHNPMLFTTAYYADKRDGYVERMRARRQVMDKWGYIMRQMCADVRDFEITDAYAYNSGFDDGVFRYNCDWFKTRNPFDNVRIHDIRGYVHQFIAFLPAYQKFCEDCARFTESGNYSTTAENVYQWISTDCEFEEAHTALEDAIIEADILHYCIEHGAELNKDYKVYQSIPRNVARKYKVIAADGQEHIFSYTNKRRLPHDAGIKLEIKGSK